MFEFTDVTFHGANNEKKETKLIAAQDGKLKLFLSKTVKKKYFMMSLNTMLVDATLETSSVEKRRSRA